MIVSQMKNVSLWLLSVFRMSAMAATIIAGSHLRMILLAVMASLNAMKNVMIGILSTAMGAIRYVTWNSAVMVNGIPMGRITFRAIWMMKSVIWE